MGVLFSAQSYSYTSEFPQDASTDTSSVGTLEYFTLAHGWVGICLQHTKHAQQSTCTEYKPENPHLK